MAAIELKQKWVLAFFCNLIILSLCGQSPPGQDSTFVKKKLQQRDVEVLLSYYTQDGTHSAVTGGEGTEFLQVYSTQVNYSQTTASKRTFKFHIGADVISSASTDRIDFEMSSASRVDQHTSLGIGYSQKMQNPKNEIGGDVSFSLESDYASLGGAVWYSHQSADQSSGYETHVQVYCDDLRWGRLKKPYLVEAIGLIYPIELRGTDWFDIHNRYSYNFSFSYRKDLNQRMSLTLRPVYAYQEGLLSTPFHRVYFKNELFARVENLPQKRNQLAFGVQLNSFVLRQVILRSFYQYYIDDFGLSSHILKLEAPIKLTPKFAVSPFLRYTNQAGSRYFKPYGEHAAGSDFYTSDYDLSTFWSTNIGLNLNLTRLTESTLKWKLGGWALRYSYYHRSDGLYAHIFSAYFGFARKKEKPLQNGFSGP